MVSTLSDWSTEFSLRQGAVRTAQLVTFETHLQEQLVGFLSRCCPQQRPTDAKPIYALTAKARTQRRVGS